jgi:hypothetical protein
VKAKVYGLSVQTAVGCYEYDAVSSDVGQLWQLTPRSFAS